jgi:ParB family chromosome partitioning protein
MKRPPTAAICNALYPADMLAAIGKRWDAKDYFANVSAALRIKAATEALGEDLARTVSKMKKDEATKWCATNIPPTGWLPPQIRTAHYKGPLLVTIATDKPVAKAKAPARGKTKAAPKKAARRKKA